jgi:N-acetylneuraminic acid mutarotase
MFISKNTLLIAFILPVFLATPLCKASCNYLLDGDLNRDCRVDFYEFSILALNWLVDCTFDPQNPACSCDIKWVAEPPMLTGRYQFCGGVINCKIYGFGGNDWESDNLKSTEGYDPNTQQWVKLADNNHNDALGVEELTSAVVNGKLYVFGAYGGFSPDGDYGVFNFNEMYDPDSNSWTTLRRKPTTVAAAPSTVYKDEIYVFGGYFDSENSSKVHYRVVESYNPSNNTWRFVTNMPRVVSNMAVATIGNKAYLFGGLLGGYESKTQPLQFLDDVITYDFETGLWTTEGCARLPVKKIFHYSEAAPVIDGKVYLIGEFEADGNGYRWSDRIDIYDPVNNIWEKGPSLPMPLDSHVALVIGHKIFVLGGCNNWSFKNGPMTGVISFDTHFCSQ